MKTGVRTLASMDVLGIVADAGSGDCENALSTKSELPFAAKSGE